MGKGTMDLEFRPGDLVCYNIGGLRRHTLGVVLNMSARKYRLVPAGRTLPRYNSVLTLRVLWLKGTRRAGPAGAWPLKVPDSDYSDYHDPAMDPRLIVIHAQRSDIRVYMNPYKIRHIEKIKSS